MTLTKFVRCLGPCPRESYGVWPQAQANIWCLGTPGQKILYSKPQAQARSFHGLFGIPYTNSNVIYGMNPYMIQMADLCIQIQLNSDFSFSSAPTGKEV